eukprot:943284-Karenia_brevis.AAC.1
MEEIKIVYRAVNRSVGEFSRQHGESMMHFTTRRERAWLLLKQMNPEVQMYDELRGHLLLHSAGLTDTQKLLLKASIQNDMSIDNKKPGEYQKHFLDWIASNYANKKRIVGCAKDGCEFYPSKGTNHYTTVSRCIKCKYSYKEKKECWKTQRHACIWGFLISNQTQIMSAGLV